MSEIERALRHPVTWFLGAIASVFTVAGAILGDPTGGVATLIMVFIEQSSTIFTAFSIAGFTLAPEIPALPEDIIQGVALVAGTVFVLTIIDRLWDRLEERFKND